MADMEQYPQEWRQYEPIQPKGFDWRGFFRKLWAPIAAIGAFLAKFGVVLLKFKFLFSMFVSAAVCGVISVLVVPSSRGFSGFAAFAHFCLAGVVHPPSCHDLSFTRLEFRV